MSKASILADAERSLARLIKRIYTETPKGGPKGTSVELDGAQKDVERATARLERAQAAHKATLAEAVEYADIIKSLGGEVDFDSFMPKQDETESAPVADVDQVDGAGNPTDLSREPEPNDDDDEEPVTAPGEISAKSGPVRVGGRFAKRETVA